jgi:hypothetical protein
VTAVEDLPSIGRGSDPLKLLGVGGTEFGGPSRNCHPEVASAEFVVRT